MKQWGLHWVQVHQGHCSQQKTRFTHWQKRKRSLFPNSYPPSICTCKLLAFSCNMEITQMVIILRKTFAFCKKASSLGKLWRDFCMAFLSPVPYWQKLEKKVSFPGKAEQRSAARAWWPWSMWFISWGFSKGKARRSWGYRHILIFLVPCFTVFTSVPFKVTMSVKITDTSASNWTACFGVTFIIFFFFLHHFSYFFVLL